MKKIYLGALTLCAFLGTSAQEVVWQKDKSARLEKYYVSMDISTAWMNPLRNYYYNNFKF
ncbi:hypothetical protein [Chryseobacterium gleum]|uniref:hypothetical protein n=1 Tax=Chryseobacterium gleum TaxID=250 RepID=UPI0028AE4DC3|nr:hypothetical protein [Chryseobacterium gleum]